MEINSLGSKIDGLHMTGNTDLQPLVTDAERRQERRSENQSVSGVTTICLMQHNTSLLCIELNRLDNCGLWNVVSLLFNGCAKLLDIGGTWNMLSYTSIPEHPKHAQWVTCLVSMQAMENWDIFSFQELSTDPCNMGLFIIMLKNEVMDEWHNNGPQDLITISLHSNFR